MASTYKVYYKLYEVGLDITEHTLKYV